MLRFGGSVTTKVGGRSWEALVLESSEEPYLREPGQGLGGTLGPPPREGRAWATTPLWLPSRLAAEQVEAASHRCLATSEPQPSGQPGRHGPRVRDRKWLWSQPPSTGRSSRTPPEPHLRRRGVHTQQQGAESRGPRMSSSPSCAALGKSVSLSLSGPQFPYL